MKTAYKKLIGIAAGLFTASISYANLSISDYPLATQTTGAYPNILFLVDNSGSMDTNDVFYAPGYYSKNIYKCASGSMLDAVPGELMSINVVRNGSTSTAGTPYIVYQGKQYAWGPAGITAVAKNEIDTVLDRVCLNPYADYQVYYKDYRETYTCKPGFESPDNSNSCYETANIVPTTDVAGYYYCLAGYTQAKTIKNSTERCWVTNAIRTKTSRSCSREYNNDYTEIDYAFNSNSVSCGYLQTDRDREYAAASSTCDITHEKITIDGFTKCGLIASKYTPPSTAVKLEPSYSKYYTETGNFLNWYLSATEPRWSSNLLQPGYAGYTAAGVLTTNDTGLFWTQQPSTDFSYTGNGCSTESTCQMKGNKRLVHWQHDRMAVAKDVGKILTRNIGNVKLAIGSFWQRGDGSASSTPGWVMQEFSDLSLKKGDNTDPLVVASKTKSDANRTTLISTWAKLTADNGTPTARSMVRMARYFFQGWESSKFNYFNAKDAALAPALQTTARSIDANKTIANVLEYGTPSSDLSLTVKAHGNSSVNTGKFITQNNWCEKNAMAVLTDGQPTGDTAWATDTGPLKTYDTYGTDQEDYSGDVDYKGMIRVAGALFDHDFLYNANASLDIRDKQNIESFFISFGSPVVISDPIFEYSGRAGGGGALNTYPALSGGAVLDAMDSIIQRVTADNLGITAVAVSSTATLKQQNYAFQATYNTEFYTTDIVAINLNKNGEFTEPDGSSPSRSSLGKTPIWNAGKQLNNRYAVEDKSPASDVRKRVVYTWSNASYGMRFGSDTMTRPTTPSASFAEFDNLPAAIKNDLTVRAGSDYQERYDMMMFLLGEVANEKNHPSNETFFNEKYRQRGVYNDIDKDGLVDSVSKGGIFADSVNSSPIYIKEPLNPYNDLHYGTTTDTYSKFKALQANRPAMLYVGSSDGFLHGLTVAAVTKNAISYTGGDELFAYLPSITASTEPNRGLHYLTDPSYEHLFYVDETPTVRDAYVDLYSTTTAKSPEWRTLLIGGLGKGGRGYYALDVTCPVVDTSTNIPPGGSTALQNTCADESFGAQNILWEFSDANDVNMGYSFSQPIVAKVKYSTGLSAANDPLADNGARWAVITGNGYNSATGKAALYILFLDGGKDGTWTEGTDYIKIITDNTGDTVSSPNGLSSPTAIDTNNDGAMDRIYAGDLKGRMWVFDISAQATNTQYSSATMPWTKNILFQTGVNGSTPQAITTPPIVQRDLSKTRIFPATSPDLMVMFGTGRYLGEPDLTDKSVQTLYAVHDRGVYNLNRYTNVPSTTLKNLEPRIFTEVELTDPSGNKIKNRLISGSVLNPKQYGWYVDYANDLDKNGVISGTTELLGERLVTDMARLGPTLLMNTTIPITGSCEGNTQSYSVFLDWTTGLAPTKAFYDANNDGVIDSQDLNYVGQFNPEGSGQITVAGTNVISQSGGYSTSDKINPQTVGFSQRIGWEEKLPYGLKGQ